MQWRGLARAVAGVGLGCAAWLCPGAATAQDAGAQRFDGGRFHVYAYPADAALARSVLADAQARDTFPGLPRPTRQVTIAIAPDTRRFREWVGDGVPEWGAAVAFPAEQRLVLQGRDAPSSAGDPLIVLRHEIAHLALHEALPRADIPRWFDEGYASLAAGEAGRDEFLTLQLALSARRGLTFAALDSAFGGGAVRAGTAYALATRAVQELAALDPRRGLGLLFQYWADAGRMSPAVRQAYGLTLEGFEVQWASLMRRRYGALALATDLGILGVALLAMVGPIWWARRKRLRERLAEMAAADAAAEARAREEAIEALLLAVPPGPPPDATPPH